VRVGIRRVLRLMRQAGHLAPQQGKKGRKKGRKARSHERRLLLRQEGSDQSLPSSEERPAIGAE